MKPWDAHGSLLAPLVIGADRANPGSSGVLEAFDAAVNCVPSAETETWVGPLKRKRQSASIALQPVSAEMAKPYHRRARLVVRNPGESAETAADRWWWEVALVVLKDGTAMPAIGADRVTALLEVTRFTIQSGTMRGAWQLALLRHLWSETLRSRDQGMQVFGGQRDWKMNWITSAADAAEPAGSKK
jgi:hypothetical protein